MPNPRFHPILTGRLQHSILKGYAGTRDARSAAGAAAPVGMAATVLCEMYSIMCPVLAVGGGGNAGRVRSRTEGVARELIGFGGSPCLCRSRCCSDGRRAELGGDSRLPTPPSRSSPGPSNFSTTLIEIPIISSPTTLPQVFAASLGGFGPCRLPAYVRSQAWHPYPHLRPLDVPLLPASCLQTSTPPC